MSDNCTKPTVAPRKQPTKSDINDLVYYSHHGNVTELYIECWERNLQSVTDLIESGADVTILTSRGAHCLDITRDDAIAVKLLENMEDTEEVRSLFYQPNNKFEFWLNHRMEDTIVLAIEKFNLDIQRSINRRAILKKIASCGPKLLNSIVANLDSTVLHNLLELVLQYHQSQISMGEFPKYLDVLENEQVEELKWKMEMIVSVNPNCLLRQDGSTIDAVEDLNILHKMVVQRNDSVLDHLLTLADTYNIVDYINSKTNYGNTALHFAARLPKRIGKEDERNERVISTLVKRSPDCSIRNRFGVNAMQEAAAVQNHRSLELLKGVKNSNIAYSDRNNYGASVYYTIVNQWPKDCKQLILEDLVELHECF